MSPALSLLYPAQPGAPQTVAPFAALVHQGRARRLWMGQSLALETHQTFAFLAGAGLRVPMGTSVTLIPFRHPYEAALQARSAAALTGQPYVAGFGVSHPAFVQSLLGAPYESPLRAASEYLAAVRRFLDGGLPELEHPPVELGLGVLRPGMARTAGEHADVAITWMTPPAYVAETLVPALGARPRIATVVHVAVERDGRDPRALAHVAAAGHLPTAHYTDMLARAGIRADPADTEAGAAVLVEHGVYVFGTPAEIAGRLAEDRAAGVDEIILNLAGVLFTEGLDAALADLQDVLAA